MGDQPPSDLRPEENRENRQGDVLSTLDLLERANRGDASALNAICARYLPRLKRWASGRLPGDARSLLDTEDLVQEAILKTIHRLEGMEIRGEGALQAYFRQAIMNRVRDQIRWARRRHNVDDAAVLPDRRPSPLEAAIGADTLEAYEEALGRLSEDDQIAIHLRLELDYSYAQIAAILGKPTDDSARVAVARAVKRLSREMRT